jgi:uncharacterized repeat protein (TIGR01451 family)
VEYVLDGGRNTAVFRPGTARSNRVRESELLGEICGAELEIRMKPSGTSLDYDDRFTLRFHGADDASGWGRYIGSGNGEPGLLDYKWNTSNTSGETVTLDLAALPEADGTTTSLIDEINDVGFVDVYIQDDTAVDFAELTVEYCCPDEPTGQCDLSVEKATVDDFHYAGTEQYVINVCNVGDGDCTEPVYVTDHLPDGMSPVGASGTGWQVAISGQSVEARHDNPGLAPGDCLPPLIIEVEVASQSYFGTSPTTVENCARIEEPSDADDSNDVHCVTHEFQ